jgi:tellurite resistance protein TerA
MNNHKMLSADIKLSASAEEGVAAPRVLTQKDEMVELHPQTHQLTLQLSWTCGIDLDLHAFYRSKNGRFGHVYFGKKGNIKQPPYMQLREDAGVLQTQGNKIEQLKVYNLEYLDYLLIASNVFKLLGFSDNQESFANYGGQLTISSDKQDSLVMPLNSSDSGKWCVIAKLDNTLVNVPKMIYLNRVQKQEPTMGDF